MLAWLDQNQNPTGADECDGSRAISLSSQASRLQNQHSKRTTKGNPRACLRSTSAGMLPRMSDKAPTIKQETNAPAETADHGASDATLWLFLGGVTFMLLVLILFIFAAS